MPSQLRVRPAYRPFRVRVASVERLSPHFARISFMGDDLADFGTARRDQRIKVLLPLADGTIEEIGQADGDADWYARWRALPDARRSPFRTYTVRAIDPDAALLTVDFVLHSPAGPAGEWAANAAVGQEIVIVGPDERSPQREIGLDWHPGTARRVLLAGDETAVPAMAGILASLDESVSAQVFAEVPEDADILRFREGQSVRVTWLPRAGAAHGELLTAAVTAWAAQADSIPSGARAPGAQSLPEVDVDRELLWDSPDDGDGEFYAWIAGESSTVKGLRRLLVRDHGIDRRRVAFMGYWRNGQAERQ